MQSFLKTLKSRNLKTLLKYSSNQAAFSYAHSSLIYYLENKFTKKSNNEELHF